MTLQLGLHLISVIPAMLLGLMIILNKKGTFFHKFIGRTWVGLMLVTSLSSFYIKSEGTFSWIHVLSVVSLVSIAISIYAIRKGYIKMHRGFMIGAYCGAITAGFFAIVIPGRFIHTLLFKG